LKREGKEELLRLRIRITFEDDITLFPSKSETSGETPVRDATVAGVSPVSEMSKIVEELLRALLG
jgi:hypothetical protein